MAKNIAYRDLDLNMQTHPVTGDLLTKTNDEAIKQAIKTLVRTQLYERPMHPSTGNSIYGLLFELDTPVVRMTIKDVLKLLLAQLESRITVNDISVNHDEFNGYEVLISYTIRDFNVSSSVEVFFNRVR